MSLGDISNFMSEEKEAVKLPDLDWLALDIKDKDNYPTPNNVESIPQLVQQWSHNDVHTAELIPNQISVAPMTEKKASSGEIQSVVDTAKKEMMKGLVGKGLVERLSSLYQKDLLIAAKDELSKVAQEQGLLGNVYIDLSPFESCAEASKVLGHNRIRMAKYVVGQPKRHVCASHTAGTCKELRKKVVASMEYNQDLMDEYTTHLRIAGIISPETKLASKEDLRMAIVASKNSKKKDVEEKELNDQPTLLDETIKEAFEKELNRSVADIQSSQQPSGFERIRPVLALIQDEMLKGRMGDALKGCIKKKVATELINEYQEQIKKIAALQGLLGNVYVDVSFYKSPEDAIHAIKTATTNPTYIMQSVSKGEFDNTLEKVAKATGCQILHRDGKISKKIALSYIDDLNFSGRISSDVAGCLKGKVEASDNTLGVIKEAFLQTLNYVKPQKEGGVKAYFASLNNTKYGTKDKLKTAAYKSLEAGYSVDKVREKLSEKVNTIEAEGMIRDVLASLKEVNADVLSNCKNDKYKLASDAYIKKTAKCMDCVLAADHTCTKQRAKFSDALELEKPSVQIDPKTQKILLADNPDNVRIDMNQEYDMTDSFGSGMNISLEKMRPEANKESSIDMDISFNSEGLDDNLGKV